jgi:hypothetical protein
MSPVAVGKDSPTKIARAAAQAKKAANGPTIGANMIATHSGGRVRWFVVGGTAALVVAIVGFFVLRSSSNASATPPSPPVAARAAAPPMPTAAPKPVPPPAPAVPASIRVRIITHPADATVLLDGKKLGHTPFDETMAPDPGKHTIKLRRRGYATQSIDVGMDADVAEDVTLPAAKSTP